MARVRSASKAYFSGESTIVVSDQISLTNTTGNLLLMWIAVDGGGRTITDPTGWSRQYTGTNIQGITCALLYRVTTAPNESLPDVTISATDEVSVTAVCCRGDFTGTIFADAVSGNGSDTRTAYPSITTTNDKSLVLYFGGIDAVGMEPPAATFREIIEFSDPGNVDSTFGWRWQESTGTIPTLYGRNTGGDGYQAYVVSVLDNVTSDEPPVKLGRLVSAATARRNHKQSHCFQFEYSQR